MTPDQIARLAAESRLSEVTIFRWLAGMPTNGATGERLADAARKLRIRLPTDIQHKPITRRRVQK